MLCVYTCCVTRHEPDCGSYNGYVTRHIHVHVYTLMAGTYTYIAHGLPSLYPHHQYRYNHLHGRDSDVQATYVINQFMLPNGNIVR